MSDLLKVVIVDDERIMREGMVNQIGWEDLGMEVAMAASNSIEALNFIKENIVDIVITDIRMPVMDGLTMIEKLLESQIEPVFVLLSGYGEFDYAKRALRMGVKDYLLKPANEEEIVLLLSRIKDDIHRKRNEEIILQKQIQYKNAKHKKNSHTKFSKPIMQIIQIIEEEIGNETLSLKWISQNKLYLDQNYLSKLFHKEVGKRFSAYLVEQRMQVAMYMFATEDCTIMQVAEKVGFGNNTSYFSMVFKKYTKLTPGEYRKTING